LAICRTFCRGLGFSRLPFHERENVQLAADLNQKAFLAESIHQPVLVLHADNGGPIKGASMLSTLQRLGFIFSFSRPSVSDDNPYLESFFRMMKYASPGRCMHSTLSDGRECVVTGLPLPSMVHNLPN